MRYALRCNAHALSSFSVRACELQEQIKRHTAGVSGSKPPQDFKGIKGNSAPLMLSPGDFDQPNKGYLAWARDEQLQLATLLASKQQASSSFGGHLELEVLDGEVTMSEGKKGCFRYAGVGGKARRTAEVQVGESMGWVA